jgi:pyrimidine oxygenase
MTIDSIAPGRFGINIVTGWQPKEYQQMGLWPGQTHFERRYDYVSEYVRIMRELWTSGRSDFKGEFFQMDDCVLSPLPSGPIQIVGAGQSDRGMRFVAEYGDFNFVGAPGLNDTSGASGVVARLSNAVAKTGRSVGALLLLMIITAETDEAAFSKWERYKEGTDIVALQWQATQAGADSNAQEGSTASNLARVIKDPQPTGILKLIGSYESIARMLDEIAQIPDLKGVMLTFDDFIIGMEQFGEHIQPRMKSRAPAAG